MGHKFERYENGVLVESYDTRTPEDLEKEITNKRVRKYGTAEEQLEYLVENGVDALKQRNLQIKANNPKPVKK